MDSGIQIKRVGAGPVEADTESCRWAVPSRRKGLDAAVLLDHAKLIGPVRAAWHEHHIGADSEFQQKSTPLG